MATSSERLRAIVQGHTVPYHTESLIRQHHVVADEPTDLGGADDGPTPMELLTASLGACTSITLRMYAQRKGWPLAGVDVEVTFERDEAQQPLFRRAITLRGDLTLEQRERLLQIANQCPVHKILSAPVAIHSLLSQPAT